MTQKEFDKLSSLSQWEWVVKNNSIICRIELDNDDTAAILENGECLTLRNWLGATRGSIELLLAIGIHAEYV